MATTTARRRRTAPSPEPAFSSTTTTTSTSTSTSTSTTTPTSKAPTPNRPLPEHEEAERAARSFLEALARGDASALAAAASDRFSFDGDVQSGREAIRRTWRDLFAARASAPVPAVGSLEILPAQDAAARFGKPPVRLAPLVRSGVLVAVGDVGGRTVVLFVAREGGRMAVLGMHD
jgi:hypothetical protein